MLNIIKTILLTILSPFKAIFALFCRKRFRKILEKTKSEENLNQNNSQDHTILDFDQSWNKDFKLEDQNSNAAKIQQYRSQLYNRQKSENETLAQENSVNFFQDMEPENIRQAKIFVGKNQKMSENRLSVSNSVLEAETSLGNWGENSAENQGWEAEEEDLNDVLKEHRKMRKGNV